MRQWVKEHFELGHSRARLIPMEGLRGFAVSLVFLHHYAVQDLVLLPPTGKTAAVALALRSYGNLGVELFFILSGYLIYGTLLKRPSFGQFMMRRAQRIYPAFLVAFGIFLAANFAAPGASKIPANTAAAALYILENILLLPGLFSIEPMMAVAWSLSYEMFFYVATAAVVVALSLNLRSKTFRIILILSLALALTAIEAISPGAAPIRMAPFFAGMLLVEVGEDFAIPAWLGLSAVGAAFLATIVFQTPLSAAGREWLHAIAFMLLCGACFRGRNTAAAIFSWAPLRWLGNMSYSYYLVHGLPVKAAMEIIARIAPTAPSAEFWILLLPVFALSLIPAAALFLVVEKPLSLRPGGAANQRAVAPAISSSCPRGSESSATVPLR